MSHRPSDRRGARARARRSPRARFSSRLKLGILNKQTKTKINTTYTDCFTKPNGDDAEPWPPSRRPISYRPRSDATAAGASLPSIPTPRSFLRPLRSQASIVPRSPHLLRSNRSSSRLTWGKHRPETYVDVPGRRVVAAADRRPAMPAVAAPTAPANHAVRASRSPSGINPRPSRIRAIPIPTPLPQVPVHVI